MSDEFLEDAPLGRVLAHYIRAKTTVFVHLRAGQSLGPGVLEYVFEGGPAGASELVGVSVPPARWVIGQPRPDAPMGSFVGLQLVRSTQKMKRSLDGVGIIRAGAPVRTIAIHFVPEDVVAVQVALPRQPDPA